LLPPSPPHKQATWPQSQQQQRDQPRHSQDDAQPLAHAQAEREAIIMMVGALSRSARTRPVTGTPRA